MKQHPKMSNPTIMYKTKQSPTGHMQLSSSIDEFSGLGLVGPAHIDARVVTPRVPNHQVGCEDNHISGNGLSV